MIASNLQSCLMPMGCMYTISYACVKFIGIQKYYHASVIQYLTILQITLREIK